MKPCRTCIACKRKNVKEEFFRITSKENIAYFDKNQKQNARGIYLCKNKECLKKCIKLLEKNKLNIKVSVDISSLKKVIEDVENELGE